MSKDTATPLSRRRVFAGAGTVGALAAAAAVLPLSRQTQAVAAAQPVVDDDQGRYQATQHVLRYYQTTKV
jgi:hypothetical protein